DKQFIAQLHDVCAMQLESEHYALKTYYDTFDWRLYRDNMLCEFNESKKGAALLFIHLTQGHILAALDTTEVPRFAHDFPTRETRQLVAPLLAMRALIP